jgi:hypothetical protein
MVFFTTEAILRVTILAQHILLLKGLWYISHWQKITVTEALAFSECDNNGTPE